MDCQTRKNFVSKTTILTHERGRWWERRCPGKGEIYELSAEDITSSSSWRGILWTPALPMENMHDEVLAFRANGRQV